MQGNQPQIPVLVELRYYRTSILDLIQDFLQRHDPNLTVEAETLKTWLREGQLLLLLDGLNELPSEEARRELQKFRQDYRKTTPMIFTTRDLGVGGDLDITKKLEMQPLSEAQMQQFVRAYLPEQGEQMLRQLGSRLRELGQTPLLLLMLCSLFNAMGKVPPNLGLVFRQFANSYDRKLKQDIPISKESRRWWQKLLERLALAMTQGFNRTELRVAISIQEAEELLTTFLCARGFDKPRDFAICCLKDLLNHHLLQLDADAKITFIHQFIQEYYTAESLLEQLSELSDYELKREYLNYPKWTESFVLMLGLVDQELQAIRIVKTALEVDLRLGARLAGVVKPEFQAQTIGLIDQLEIPQPLKFRLFGIARSDTAIFFLIQALMHEDPNIRRDAASVLGKVGEPELLPYLSEILLKRITTEALDDVLDLISIIQRRCQYYSYTLHYNYTLIPAEIWQIGSEVNIPLLRPAFSPQALLKSFIVKENPMEQKLTVRIVVASPSDVNSERKVLSDVIEELNHGIAAERGLRFELSRWETDAYPGFHPEGRQGLLNSTLRIDNCDILIGIFWKRVGTPVKDTQSGTEHEFSLAYEAWKKQERPQIMFYFCERAYTPRSKEEIDQWGEVLEFKRNFPKEGLWWTFKRRSEFERLVRNHLTQLVRQNWGERKSVPTGGFVGIPPIQPISTSLMHILHLSDLHFGTLDQANLWSNQLAADLYNDLSIPHLDALILSGDIANYSTEEEYKAAAQFLHNLRQDFPLNPEQIILVPGNHDLNWKQAKKAYKLIDRDDYDGELKDGHYIEESASVIRVRDEAEYKQRFTHFSQFYETIKQKPYPLDYDQQYTLDHLKEQNLLILGLNSAWQLDHHYKSRASINTNALSNALTQIRRNPDYRNCLKIAVWHHPLDSAYSDRITDQGFLEQLAVNGFRFFLHGHIHKAETSLFRYDMSTNGRKLDRICAGTFGAPVREWVPGYPLQYNLLKIADNQLTVYTRRREELNGAWKPDARWLQGAGKTPLDYYAIDL